MDDLPVLTPEVLVPRLGDFLVENKFIQPIQLEQALATQSDLKKAGKAELLGDILINHGFIDRKTLDQAITTQILQLRNALQDANQTLELKVIQRTKELQAALNKLSELDQLKSNFIANISHELRTPLTHIKGYQELLLAGVMGALNPEQQETVGIIKKASERLEKLIDDLINTTQISKGNSDLSLSPANFPEIVQTVVEQTKSKADENKIHLKALIDEKLPVIRIDQPKIIWVIRQLVDNALKFTPEQGEVIIEVKCKEDSIWVAVEDTGIGIPEDKLNEIFEPFHQLDGNAARKYSGTGIGLTLARQIIQAHKSDLTVSSKLGEKTRFEFILKPSIE